MSFIHRMSRKSTLLLATALLSAACVRSNDGVDTSPEAVLRRDMEQDRVLMVQIVNRSTYGLDIYVLRGSARFRIGEARPVNTTNIEVPSDLVQPSGTTILAVTSPGGQRVASPNLNVRPGNTIIFEITADLRSSRAYVR